MNICINKKRQKGASLLDLILTVVVIGVIAAIALAAYKKVTENISAQAAVKEMVPMVAQIQSAFKPQGNFDGLATANVISLNIPNKERVSGTSILNAWSQGMTFAPAGMSNAAATSDYDAFSITTTVPAQSCSKFVSAIENIFWKIEVGSSTTLIKDVTANTFVNVPSLATACNASASGSGVGNTSIVLYAARF